MTIGYVYLLCVDYCKLGVGGGVTNPNWEGESMFKGWFEKGKEFVMTKVWPWMFAKKWYGACALGGFILGCFV